MEIAEFVRLELLVVAALFSGLAYLVPKIIKAAKGSPATLPNESVGIRLIIERLGAIERRLERAEESRAKLYARIDKQSEALVVHERGCYDRALKTELRLGRIEAILERLVQLEST